MHEENDIKLEEIFRSIELLSGDFLTLPQEGAGAEERLCSREELEEQGFCEAQIDEIMTGMKQQLSTGYYARSCYNWKQMREIRMGLLENLDVGIYANYLFSAEQMREIRMGLLENMDVHSYANLIFSAMDMAKARKKLLGDAYCKNPEGFAREFSDEETGIRIRISNDCMKAYVTIPKECSCCEEKLERVLNQNDIICGISKAQLRKACREEMREQEIRVAEESRKSGKGRQI